MNIEHNKKIMLSIQMPCNDMWSLMFDKQVTFVLILKVRVTKGFPHSKALKINEINGKYLII
jgi:hypothetical protein